MKGRLRPEARASPALQCLGFRWRMRSNDPAFVAEVADLFGSCEHSEVDDGAVCFSAIITGDSVDLARDATLVLQGASRTLARARLVWEVNSGVTSSAPDATLLLHAAAAADAGRAVVLAGPSGSGKSTLVAALVGGGMAYVTDEATSVRIDDGTLEPYPKPIALGYGGASALALRAPPFERLAPGGPLPTSEGLLVTAAALGGRVADAGALPAMIVFPRFVADAGVVVEPVHRAEALTALARNSFNFRHLGPSRLPALAATVSRCRCYRIEFGDLQAACAAVGTLLADPSAHPVL